MFGQVREIYETCIEAEAPYGLPDEDCKKMCLGSVQLKPRVPECQFSNRSCGLHDKDCAKLKRILERSTSVWLLRRPFAHSLFCLCRYAKLEKGLGEIDRARAIYIHASAMADPRRDTGFWADWNAFEVCTSSSSLSFCLIKSEVIVCEA